MRRLSYACVVAFLFVGIASASYVDQNFDALTAGSDFTGAGQDGWVSTNTGVVVSTATNNTSPNSVLLPAGGSISNGIAASGPTKVWTEFRIVPMLGAKPYSSTASSNSTCALYFDESGNIAIWNTSDWTTCSNNVWEAPVAALDGSNWVDIAIYQDFANDKAVVFVNGVAVLQDIPFSDATENDYNFFVVDNVDSNAYLDDVRVDATYDSARLANTDNNGINGPDGAEVDAHGYIGRTLYVGTGGPAALSFTNLQDAVNEARNLDRISLSATNINENITFENRGTESNTYYLIGSVFTNSGTFTVASGATLHIAQNVEVATTDVAGTLSLSNDLTTASLTVSGTLLSAGGTITATTAGLTGSGSVTAGSGGTLDLGTLTMATGTSIDVTSGDLTESDSDVHLTGTFTLDAADWNDSASATASLTFTETFEDFTNGMALNSKSAQLVGWGASSDAVKVQQIQKHGGLRAVMIPAGETLSNRISTTEMKVWTEYYIIPALGVAPDTLDTNKAVFLSYVNTNGYMVVPDGAGWKTNDTDLGGSPATAMTTDTWTRVDIFTDFTDSTNKYALFINGKITVEQQAFVGAAASASYKSFSVINEDNVAYIDDVLITAEIPSGMIEDVNGIGVPDAYNIHNYGTIYPPANGSLFKFK
jgi:hypothetical protein